MAQPLSGVHVLGSWSADDPDIGSAEEAIRRLRGRDRAGALRTSVLSLVVLADDDPQEATAALGAARALVARVPGRAIVVSTFPDDERGTRASVTVRAIERESGPALCVEDVRLQVRGDAVDHLSPIVAPWILPGIPLAVWLPRRLPHQSERLVTDADRVLIDCDRLAEPIREADLIALGRVPATDLAWLRLEPWRRVLAGAFAGDQLPFLDGIERLDASGTRTWTERMAGWLMSRLGLTPAVIQLVEAEQAAVHFVANHSGRQATVAAEALEDDEVRVTTTVADGPPRQRRLRLPPRSLATDLEAALTARPGRNDTWDRAMACALRLQDRH